MFMLSFSISFVCLVILFILYVISLWDSAPAHSPSSKELNPSSQEDAHLFRALHIDKLILLYPASSLFETQQQLTHLPVKSLTLPLTKMPVFQGVATCDTIFTLSYVIFFGTQQQLTHPPVKSLTLALRKMPGFSGRCTLAYIFHFNMRHPSLGLSNSSLTLGLEDTRLSERCALT